MKTEISIVSKGIIIVFLGATLMLTGCAMSEKAQTSPLMSPIQEIFYSKTMGLKGPAPLKELEPLATTRWKVVSVSPKLEKPYSSTEFSFNSNGILVESAELPNGTIVTDTHLYRVIGSTLILAKDERTAFARFTIEGDTLSINADAFTITLEKMIK
jgi:hypothetical protein